MRRGFIPPYAASFSVRCGGANTYSTARSPSRTGQPSIFSHFPWNLMVPGASSPRVTAGESGISSLKSPTAMMRGTPAARSESTRPCSRSIAVCRRAQEPSPTLDGWWFTSTASRSSPSPNTARRISLVGMTAPVLSKSGHGMDDSRRKRLLR